MKFFEAVEIARKTGKKIRCLNASSLAYWEPPVWDKGLRRLELHEQPLYVTDDVLDSEWEVIEPTITISQAILKAAKHGLAVNFVPVVGKMVKIEIQGFKKSLHFMYEFLEYGRNPDEVIGNYIDKLLEEFV